MTGSFQALDPKLKSRAPDVATLVSRFNDGSESYNMGPSLSDLEPSALEEGLRLLDEAAQAGDCDSFHTRMAHFLALNGSQGDVAGYLKNHVPHCQRTESLTP